MRTSSANANGSSWIRRDKRLSIYLRDDWLCAYCLRDLSAAAPRDVTLDHLVPRSQGGSNAARNLVLCCLACNSSRADQPWRFYATPEAAARIARCRRRKLPLAAAREQLSNSEVPP